MSGRPIGDEVEPPDVVSDVLTTYHSGLSKRSIRKGIFRRMLILLLILTILSVMIIVLIFSPLLIVALTSEPIAWEALGLPLFIFCLFLSIMALGLLIGIPVGMKKVGDCIPANRIDLTRDALRVNLKISNMAASRQLEVPLKSIKDLAPADDFYWQMRKCETRFYHKLLMYRYKPRMGDYYHIYSRKEDIIIIRMRKPLFVPYFDHIWTGSELPQKGRKVEKIAVDVDRNRHREFRDEVLKRGRSW